MRIVSFLIIILSLIPVLQQKTTSPHGPKFRTSCRTCHSTQGWQLDLKVYSFDHSRTGFPLAGQHAKIDCRQCHSTLVFADAKTGCSDCHTDVHQATTGLDCARCHNASSWLVNNISEIHQRSRFPLLGPHRTADCYNCHKSESLTRFDVTGINCIDCHRPEYLATTNPDHARAGFSLDCSTCHILNSFQWGGVGFDHSFFALAEAHSIPVCSDCHTTPRYSDASPECSSCHRQDYLATTNPNHPASNFPLTCKDCHTLNPGWKPASFDHSSFPLTLGHAGVNCTECHAGGNYSTVTSECYSCHKGDYDNSANPKHPNLGFSLVCTLCHTTDPGWKPASYLQHDSQFPVYSGAHRGEWNNCTDCHTNTSNYSQFSCLTCHEHSKADMDDKHRGMTGYSYDSPSCLRCHPTGKAD